MKIQIGNSKNITSLEETQKIAQKLAPYLRKGDCIALSGELGAGKTTFTRFLLKALNPAIEEVPSPTFTLVQLYETPESPVSHFDCYRLENPKDLRELGFEEAHHEGIVLLEWPEKVGPVLPTNTLWIYFTFEEDRKITFKGNTLWQERLQSL